MRKELIIWLLIGLFTGLHAQEKVGVVLSGGGAKGLAHIGVLKALEENNIPIDYIVGTSMGAVVGAFYASGMSPDEIEVLTKMPSFQNWINGTETEKYQYSFIRKERDASWVSFDLLLSSTGTPQINTPIANDFIINFVLNEYLTPANQVANSNFNQLFVPFRAMAADVFTQTAISQSSGSLMKAVRSSMTVPLFYRPIKNQDKYLFDGGIYNNFPVDVMKKDFKPDVIIGVNVATKVSATYPFEEDEDKIGDALLFMLLDKTNPARLDKKDIYIEPNVNSFTAMDFPKVNALIDSGYAATHAKMGEIKSKTSRTKKTTLLEMQRKNFKQQFKPFEFGEMKLNGFESKQEAYIQKLLNFEDGKKEINDINQAYFELLSEPYFKNIYPGFYYNREANHHGLELNLKPTANNELTVKLGGNLSTREVSTLQIGAIYNAFNRKLNTYSLEVSTGRFYQAVHAGARFNFNPHYRLFAQPYFRLNEWDYFNTEDVLDNAVEPVLLNQVDRKVGIELGIGLNKKTMLTADVGYFRNSDNYSNLPEVRADEVFDRLDLKAVLAKVSFEKNTLNKKQFPTKGERWKGSLSYLDGTSGFTPGTTSDLFESNITTLISTQRNWWTLKLGVEKFITTGSAYTFGWQAEAVYSNLKALDNYNGTLLYSTSFNPMFNSQTYFLEDFRAPAYLAAGMRHIFQMKKNLSLRIELYGFSKFRTPIKTENQSTIIENKITKPIFIGGSTLVYESLAGPLSFHLNYIQDNTPELGFMLSFGYLIFGERSHY